MTMRRREFLKTLGATALPRVRLAGCAVSPPRKKAARPGGGGRRGYGGATAAKYLGMWSNGTDRQSPLVEARAGVRLLPAVQSRARR